MEVTFKFSIGQFVTTAQSKAVCEVFHAGETDAERKFAASVNRATLPTVMTVLERRYQECSGGSQVDYLCRYVSPQGYTEHFLNEIELVEHPNLSAKKEKEHD